MTGWKSLRPCTTRGSKETKNNIFSKISSDTPPVVTATVGAGQYPHMGCRALSQCTSEFLVAHSTSKRLYLSEVMKAATVFWYLKHESGPFIKCTFKNIADCVPSRGESSGTPPDPPLFWLDNIFKIMENTTHCKDKMLKFRNKYSQKRNIGVSVPISTFMRLWAIYIFILLEEICRPILGLYKSLTDTWMLKLGLRPHFSQKRKT